MKEYQNQFDKIRTKLVEILQENIKDRGNKLCADIIKMIEEKVQAIPMVLKRC